MILRKGYKYNRAEVRNCLFSVVLPAYNCEKTIYQVLESIKNQTRFDLISEIIIINDGSIDCTGTIIQSYMKENPQINIKYIEQTNHGVSYSRNIGILAANDEWIALIDSDDIWLENKIERQAYIIKTQKDILFLGSSDPLIIGFKRCVGLNKVNARQLCIRYLPSTPTVVFHKETGKKLGLYNEKMKYCEDINFFQKFLLEDSYYVLGEKQVKVNIGKKYHAESGLSSNLIKMAKGRNSNIIELYKMGLISPLYMFVVMVFGEIKLIRRIVFKCISRLKYKNENAKSNMFSVVIPVYNCESTIMKSLESIQIQTRKDLIEEVIIVNDGSTDHTGDKIKKYIKGKKLEKYRYKYIEQDNHGISHARNTGIENAKGKWIALLEAGDVWLPNKIERQYEVLSGNN